MTVVLIGTLSVVLQASPSTARPAVSRYERCNRFSQQLDKAIKSKKPSHRTEEAKALLTKAKRLCATKREAQGMRAIADGMKLLNAKLVDP
ncbi:hypothetical protein [Jiella sp. M17.18]|uniref:hypothetical protein n=1 Tax=Jiella sp. M17.18 TaxID=3234247 RepID=UPI0034E03730